MTALGMIGFVPCGPALAQDGALWDASKIVNLISNRVVEAAVSAARTVAQVSYDNVTYDRHTERFYLSNLQVVPFGLDLPDGCEVSLGGVGIAGKRADYDATDIFEMVFDDVFVSTLCLPFEMRAGLAMAGLSDVVIPSVQMQFSHHYPSAATDIALSAAVAGAAAVTMTADLDYISITDDSDFPIYAELTQAQVSLENLGAWDSLAMQLPKEFKTPGVAGQTIAGLITPELIKILGQQQGLDAADQIKTTVDAFLENPRHIRLQTNINPQIPLRLDPSVIGDVETVLARLNPTLQAHAAGTLPNAVLASLAPLTQGRFTDLAPEDLFDIAQALQTGQNMPRNHALARDIFEFLLDRGVTDAAQHLTEIAIAQGDFDQAYAYGQIMAQSGQSRARAVLNKLETHMPLSAVLAHQRFEPAVSYDMVLRQGQSPYELANQSLMGLGVARSYQTAYYWAVLSLAQGDQRAQLMIETIEGLGAGLSDAERTEWRETISGLQARAWTDWTRAQM